MRVAVGQAAPDRPVGKPASPDAAPAEGPARLQCFADVRANTVRCGDNTPAAGNQASIIYGGQHLYVSLLTSNVATVADTLAFDLAIKNLIPQAIGTTDGVTVDPVKVFFAADPQSSGGTVRATNHDGAQSFTTAEPQKFFSYPEIIQPQATSSTKRWKLHTPGNAQNFTFFLYVSSPVVYDKGWVDVFPKTAEIGAGSTLQLTDTVRNPVGRPIPGATTTWSSSNTAVATVNASGVVTAVADGTVQITGSSAPRAPGQMTLTVISASLDSSRFTATPPTLPVRDTATITLQLRSATGVPLTRSAGVAVFSADGGALGAVTNNNDGTYTARLTSTTVGTVRVSGTLNGAALRDTAQVVFTAGAGAAYRVTSSADTVPAGTAVTITAQTVDADGNPVSTAGTTVTWSSTGGGSFATPTSTTGAGGAATVVFTTATGAGVTHTVSATDGSLSGTSGSIVTSAGAAAKLVITQQPTSVTAGAAITPAVVVQIQDANGNVVTGAADSVAIAIDANPATGTLSGTAKVAAVGGVATFANLSIDKAGTGYTLAATSGILTGATSGAFNVTAGAASQLTLTTQPADSVQSGAAFAQQPVVQLRDAL
ncbi:MAG TPA: invasin domain 3-containing protein, partial [Longimicrobium sp.]